MGLLFWDNTEPIPLAEASVVRSNGNLKSGFVRMTSSDARILRRWSNALRWVLSITDRSVLPFENMSKRPGNGGKILEKASVIARQAEEGPEAKQSFGFWELLY